MTKKMSYIQELLKQQAISAVIIKSPENKRYLKSLTGSGVYLVITPDESYQFFDGRYRQEIQESTQGFKNIEVPQGEYLPAIISWLGEAGQKIAIEPVGISIKEYSQLCQNYTVVVWQEVFQRLRSIKSQKEIEKIQAACLLTDEIFAEILPKIHVGMEENELAAWIHFLAIKGGASGMAFPPIVASGERSALPHGRATKRTFANGDFLIIDFGVVLDGYQSDMTRTVAIGTVEKELASVYAVVKEAQLTAIAEIAPGKSGGMIDASARKVIEAAGYGEYFNHGLGHGIGLGGDWPILNPTSEILIEESMVMSCEPGIYLPKVGGVRIEDDVVVVNGSGISLNKTTKELLIVGE